ncbi:adenosylcobinamide amidohydrolase [Desulfonema magnum]|uniref:ABC transporter, substrate-binding protein n=1 Tax=Desulfonema magnum TaxID=45655 RepID=A0A975BI50_9BACT|nr:adenosylcobinamide amidohydrolase [Desulfonema magnum]QTA85891.1 putative ABC transporter, substrate-binding protein [Desulfonema magnum]
MKKIFVILIFTLWSTTAVFSYPITFKDTEGAPFRVEKRPERVVSLVPGITEIIFKIGAGDAVRAVTYHDTYPPEISKKKIVGGFFSPSLEKIEKIQPDIIFISDIHKKVKQNFKDKCQVITLRAKSVSDNYQNILLLGKIFERPEEAAQIVREIKTYLETIALKIKKIPESERKRVIRLMGRDQVMTPGDDSFQNEYIRLAGGIPPKLNKNGQIVTITKEEWINFNPQVIYGCGGDRETAKVFFSQPGWKDVDAVKNGKIFYFPCELTCRASTRAGYFVSCLASLIYEEEFENKENQVIEDHVAKSVPLRPNLDYIKNIQIVHNYLFDFIHKTLVIELNAPMSVVSTLEGYRQGIKFVGNSYSPPQVWGIYHKIGLEASRERLYNVLQKTEKNTSFLFTGADMDNLSVKKQNFKDMEVYALVTAGVKSNAVRMSKDTGNFYEPGTINMILLSNMKLTKRAMTRAIISATEAKTAALNDMDIRSTYTSLVNQATGTGTDNIIVVEGTGTPIENAGGHSKMGELIGKAVYEAVQEAVYKQNGLIKKRDIFKRLKDRKISLSGLITECKCDADKSEMAAALEAILLDQRYASFLEAAFAISDHYEQGLIEDLSFFKAWCDLVREEIAGPQPEKTQNPVSLESLPDVLKMAFDSILNGMYANPN